MKPILILGLGNPLQGDDGIGCRVAQELAGASVSAHLPDDVEVMDGGTPGIGLVNLLEGRVRVILVDAAEMGRAPGEVVRFSLRDAALNVTAEQFSLHAAGIADALALGRALNLTLPEIVVYGVQPARVGWGTCLSPPVAAAVPQVVAAVLREARVYNGERKDSDH